ncbi:vWA domain-containing protein [Rhodohalobacter barkolensis]|uniref:Aerotolerance regulator BatA n=1 Tax=Rhodohalobacter barkolensis TaxID=2053187 RepID=A0A2N0VKQ3_9BACT|nr:VWA domain-containing protein [Rhodohalobacter barkolensis]PKD44744.1 aerotolerance regulator BatA [Rhodohalobacter barkolensis]
MSWANPEYFWLLLLIPLFIGYRFWMTFKKREATLTFSSLDKLKGVSAGYKTWLTWVTPLLQIAAFTLFITALARPQLQNTTVEQYAEGIDIVISLDISSSMMAEDIKPNRLIASKELAASFIDKRISDRIGINVFARESFTVVPPTLDYNLVKNMLETVDLGMVRDGTAIGMGIATAINRLRESEAESKVIILLTDGMNNAGEIDPITAGDIAASYDIRIYSIGIGSRGTAPYPVDDPIFGRRYQNVQVNIDEEMLTQISTQTGGKYWRATDTQEYEEIYEEIDQLEQSEIEEVIYVDYEDQYFFYLLGGIFLVILAFVNERFVTRSPLFQP